MNHGMRNTVIAIGINKYQHLGIPTLHCLVNDANEMKKFLKHLEFDITTITSNTVMILNSRVSRPYSKKIHIPHRV